MAVLATDVDTLAQEVLDTLPMHRTGPDQRRTMPVHLPVFLDIPRELATLPWEELLPRKLPSTDRARLHAVRLARRRWVPRPPVRLPLKVLSLGIDQTPGGGLSRLRRARWLRDGSIPEHGFRLVEESVRPDVGAARSLLRRFQPDVVVTEGWPAGTVLQAAGGPWRSVAMRPRLVVVLADGVEAPDFQQPWAVPAGMSLLLVPLRPGRAGAGFVREFFLQVVHDCAVHEAASTAARAARVELAMLPRLWADPASNQDLRIADAFAELAHEGRSLEAVVPEHVDLFLERVGDRVPARFASSLLRAAQVAGPVRAAVDAVDRLRVDFRRESWGLQPLAHVEAAASQARPASETVNELLSGWSDDSELVAVVAEQQYRRVDVALERLEHSSLLVPSEQTVAGIWLSPSTVLRGGARYRLSVRIGRRGAGSLVVGEPPPIDPLLPGGKGHDLEVAVYGFDFEILGQNLKALQLPPLGATGPVEFEIRAPLTEVEQDARLRISVYHKNQVVQSFLLQARVAREESLSPSPVLTVTLAFSQTARFTNLDELERRALTIEANQGPGASHTFMTKGDGEARPVHIEAGVLEDVVRDFRKTLWEATYDGGQERLYVPATRGQAPPEGFAAIVRTLADLGKEVHRALKLRAGKKLLGLLTALADTRDQTIQIIRYDLNYHVPWATLYDFDVPALPVGADPAPVCLGFEQGGAGDPGDPPVRRCRHSAMNTRSQYCVYGFWGVRHRVEELLALEGTGTIERDKNTKVTRAAEGGALCVSVDLPDQFTIEMEAALRQRIGSTIVRTLTRGDDLFELLWQTADRPKILLVIGHLETNANPGELPGPRIVIPPVPKWLRAKDIIDRIREQWEQPNSLILLLACGSASIDAKTLYDFVSSMLKAGAGAVIGTETTVFTTLASRFAEEVTLDMWSNRATLGEALTAFRRRLIASGNPLGLVFTSFGPADLTVVP